MSDEIPTSDISWAVVEYLLELVELEPAIGGAGVGVFGGWPGDAGGPELVWLSGIDSIELEYPVMTGARIPVNEAFAAHLQVGVFTATTIADAQARLSEIVGAIDSRLRERPNLDGRPGVRSALVTSKRRSVAQTPDGVEGYAEVIVTVETRLQ